MKRGQRIESGLIWVEIETIRLGDDEKAVVISLRRSHGGELLKREIVTPEMATALRQIAAAIEDALADASKKAPEPSPEAAR